MPSARYVPSGRVRRKEFRSHHIAGGDISHLLKANISRGAAVYRVCASKHIALLQGNISLPSRRTAARHIHIHGENRAQRSGLRRAAAVPFFYSETGMAQIRILNPVFGGKRRRIS